MVEHIDVVDIEQAAFCHQALLMEAFLHQQATLLGKGDGARFFVQGVIALPHHRFVVLELLPVFGQSVGFLGRQLGHLLFSHLARKAVHHFVDQVVFLCGFLGGSADDERGAGLVDEDGVHLVHDGEMKRPLDIIFELELHVVAQIVEAKLVVGAIGDVRGVGLPAFAVLHAVLDQPHADAEQVVDVAHPLAVTFGEVIVGGDDMHSLAGKRVEVGRQGGGQGFSFPGFHFGDHALVQPDSADHLHVEMTFANDPLAGFADQGESLGEQVVKRFSLLPAVLQRLGFFRERALRQGFHLGFKGVDLSHQGLEFLQVAFVFGRDNESGDLTQHELAWCGMRRNGKKIRGDAGRPFPPGSSERGRVGFLS